MNANESSKVKRCIKELNEMGYSDEQIQEILSVLLNKNKKEANLNDGFKSKITYK